MRQALREVRLYGELGRRFGRVHRVAVASAAEAARALCAVIPGFRAAFLGPDGQQAYHVYAGRGARRELVCEENREAPVGADAPIRFVPRIAGAKRQGAGTFIVGAVLVIVAAVVDWFTDGAFASITGPMYKMGFAMMLGGVVQMLSPQRKAPDKPENNPSYGMDGGAFNNADSSAPVPLAYGRVVVGSVTISAGLTTDSYGSATPVFGGAGGSGAGSGGLSPSPLPDYMPVNEVDAGGAAHWEELEYVVSD